MTYKGYEQPKVKVVELQKHCLICQSKVETGGFSLGDDSTIEKGSDSDWNNNGGW